MAQFRFLRYHCARNIFKFMNEKTKKGFVVAVALVTVIAVVGALVLPFII